MFLHSKMFNDWMFINLPTVIKKKLKICSLIACMLLDCLESRTAITRPGCFSILVHARLPEDRQTTQLTNVLTLSDMIPVGLLGLPRATSSDWWKQIFMLFWTVCNRKFYRCESVAGIYIGGNSPVKWLINCWDCSLLFKAKLKQAQTVFGGILQKKASNEREEII